LKEKLCSKDIRIWELEASLLQKSTELTEAIESVKTLKCKLEAEGGMNGGTGYNWNEDKFTSVVSKSSHPAERED